MTAWCAMAHKSWPVVLYRLKNDCCNFDLHWCSFGRETAKSSSGCLHFNFNKCHSNMPSNYLQPAVNIFPAPDKTTLRQLLSTEILLKHVTISLHGKYTHRFTHTHTYTQYPQQLNILIILKFISNQAIKIPSKDDGIKQSEINKYGNIRYLQNVLFIALRFSGRLIWTW